MGPFLNLLQSGFAHRRKNEEKESGQMDEKELCRQKINKAVPFTIGKKKRKGCKRFDICQTLIISEKKNILHILLWCLCPQSPIHLSFREDFY